MQQQMERRSKLVEFQQQLIHGQQDRMKEQEMMLMGRSQQAQPPRKSSTRPSTPSASLPAKFEFKDTRRERRRIGMHSPKYIEFNRPHSDVSTQKIENEDEEANSVEATSPLTAFLSSSCGRKIKSGSPSSRHARGHLSSSRDRSSPARHKVESFSTTTRAVQRQAEIYRQLLSPKTNLGELLRKLLPRVDRMVKEPE